MKRIAEHTVFRVAAIIFLPMFLLLMIGCGQDTEGSGEDASATDSIDMPPIYVAQTLVLRDAGEAAVERNYRQLLKACHDGGMATTPLGEDDAKKLGRTYYQLWFDNRRSAWQADSWDFAMNEASAEQCQFHIKHESEKVVFTAEKWLSIDLMAKTATSEANSGFMPGGSMDPDDNEQFDRTTAKMLGIQRLGYATDAGQRCLRWREAKPHDSESCTWSDGRKWGFPEGMNSGQATSYDPGEIVLWVHPANGFGGELTTQKMTVGGEPFDDAVFAPPSGVTIKKKDGDI